MSDVKEKETSGASSLIMETIDYVSKLNLYSQRTRSSVHYEALGSVGPAHNKTFFQRAVVNGKAYPDGVGMTKKDAKQDAAKNALNCLLEKGHQDSANTEEAAEVVNHEINGNKTTERADETCNRASTKQKEELSISDICNKTSNLSVSFDSSFEETNYKGLVNHYCQKTDRRHTYHVRRLGLSHNPQFFVKLEIDGKSYPEAEGKTIKKAEQNAAQLAWSALQEQSDWDSKVSFRSTASEDGAPPTSSASSTTWESHESSSQSMSVSTDGSIIFADSSNPFRVQHAVKDTKVASDQNETQSRFNTDFDSMKELGSGAFGWVWKARHKVLDKYYAVKIVRCEEKCLREVGTLSDLQHDNIIRFYTCWMEDSGHQWAISEDSWSSSQSTDNPATKFLYIKMELCDTKTLKLWIDEKNAQSLQDTKRREESLNIAQQIVRGVEYIHSKEHIHRDLKPANILFGLDGKVKIGDFGLVTRDDALMDKTVGTGTHSYMAPEQIGKRYNRKVDIFPLGLIYLELLWKVSTGCERGEVLRDAKYQTFPDEFSLTFPPEKKIIESMLRRKPENRPEASALRAELEKWAETFSTQKMCQGNATV